MKTEATFIGSVRRVVGSTVYAVVSDELPSTSPIINGRVYRVGQIGSFVRIPLGVLNVYGLVSMVGAGSVKGDDKLGQLAGEAECTIEIRLVGEAYANSAFQRGLGAYPTVDDEIHAVVEDDLARIYAPTGSSPIAIGRHSASEALIATLDLDKLVSRHAAIVGSTGSGKSNTVAAILKSVTGKVFPKAQAIIFDPHGEYASALGDVSRVFSISSLANPLILPFWCLGFDELAWFLVDRQRATETIMDGILREKIAEMRKASASLIKVGAAQQLLSPDEITADSPLPFDLRELWYHFDRIEKSTFNDMARVSEALLREGSARDLIPAEFKPAGAGATPPHKPQPPPVMGNFTNRILQKLRDRRFDFLLNVREFDGRTKDLNDLLKDWLCHDKPITIFDLAGVPPEIMDLVVGLISKIILEVMFWGRNLADIGRQRPLMLVFEEAHRYLPSGDGYFIQGYARRSVQRILKEGRKYGIGSLLVSQRPSELDETILSQCGTFVALRLTNSQDQARIRSAVPDELTGLVELLPSLRTGEAIISGEATHVPSRVRIELVEPRPSSEDPEVSKLWASATALDPQYINAVTNWRRQEAS